MAIRQGNIFGEWGAPFHPPQTACQDQKVFQLSAAGHMGRGKGGLWLGILHSPECLGRHHGCVFCIGHHRGWGLYGSHSRTLCHGCKQKIQVSSFGNTESYLPPWAHSGTGLCEIRGYYIYVLPPCSHPAPKFTLRGKLSDAVCLISTSQEKKKSHSGGISSQASCLPSEQWLMAGVSQE